MVLNSLSAFIESSKQLVNGARIHLQHLGSIRWRIHDLRYRSNSIRNNLWHKHFVFVNSVITFSLFFQNNFL